MPTIQIADKPTLDAVKTDTTAILNKSNTTGTAITNLQTSVTNGFSGINSNLNTNFSSVKTTLGNVNSNVSSIKSDNLINFSSNSQVVRDTTHYLNQENIAYTIPSLLSEEGYTFIANYSNFELHQYNSYSPAINVATHRGKTKYIERRPALKYINDNSTIDLENTNLYMSCLSMPRADDDFIYYADTNYNAYPDSYQGSTDLFPTETEYTTFARNGIVYIYMFDGFSWHYAEVTGLDTSMFPKVISINKNSKMLLLNIFPTNHDHILFLEARLSSQYNQLRGHNFYYLLYPVEKNGIPVKYEAVDVSESDGDASMMGMAAGIYMPAIFFPSPVGKTDLSAPSGQGQYAWYAVTQTGSYNVSQTSSKYPIFLDGGTKFTVWGLQSIKRDARKHWTKIKDINLPSSEERMNYYTQPHMFYNLGCHLTSEPWFFFGHNETAVWIPAILYKLKATNTTVNLDKSILATDKKSDFFIPFFNVSLGSTISNSNRQYWLNTLSSESSYDINYVGNVASGFSEYVNGLTMFVNSQGQHIVATANGFIGLDDNGFFALPGDVVSYKTIKKDLSSTDYIIAHAFYMGYSRYPKTTYNVSFLRDKFYILPQPTNYEERPNKNRTTLIGY